MNQSKKNFVYRRIVNAVLSVKLKNETELATT
jgi:hypothetical protein